MLIPIARMVHSLITGNPTDVIIGTDVAAAALIILIRVVRVWVVKLTVTNDMVYIEKGVFIKSKTAIKRSRITEYYVNQTPVLLIFKATRVELFTLGGRAERLYLPQNFSIY